MHLRNSSYVGIRLGYPLENIRIRPLKWQQPHKTVAPSGVYECIVPNASCWDLCICRFCLQWAFKHAPLLHVPLCVSWAFLFVEQIRAASWVSKVWQVTSYNFSTDRVCKFATEEIWVLTAQFSIFALNFYEMKDFHLQMQTEFLDKKKIF